MALVKLFVWVVIIFAGFKCLEYIGIIGDGGMFSTRNTADQILYYRQ